MDKILRINMGNKKGPKAFEEPLADYAGLGGRGMTSAIISNKTKTTKTARKKKHIAVKIRPRQLSTGEFDRVFTTTSSVLVLILLRKVSSPLKSQSLYPAPK